MEIPVRFALRGFPHQVFRVAGWPHLRLDVPLIIQVKNGDEWIDFLTGMVTEVMASIVTTLAS